VASAVIVVDASVVFEIVTHGAHREAAQNTLLELGNGAGDVIAPSILDAEVVGVIRRDHQRGLLDATGADIAIHDLMTWPGERISISPLVERVWAVRANVRVWDGFYVALAEFVEAPLVTLDQRLAQASGPRCEFILVG
jgi:predicted nucleic acid-binding protein